MVNKNSRSELWQIINFHSIPVDNKFRRNVIWLRSADHGKKTEGSWSAVKQKDLINVELKAGQICPKNLFDIFKGQIGSYSDGQYNCTFLHSVNGRYI